MDCNLALNRPLVDADLLKALVESYAVDPLEVEEDLAPPLGELLDDGCVDRVVHVSHKVRAEVADLEGKEGGCSRRREEKSAESAMRQRWHTTKRARPTLDLLRARVGTLPRLCDVRLERLDLRLAKRINDPPPVLPRDLLG